MSIGIIDTAFSPNHPPLRGWDIIHRSFIKKYKPGRSTHGATVAALLVGNSRDGLPGGLLPLEMAAPAPSQPFPLPTHGSSQSPPLTNNLAFIDTPIAGNISIPQRPASDCRLQPSNRESYKAARLSLHPQITSVVAHHLARGGRARPDPIRSSLRKRTKNLGAPGHDNTFGWGLVQYRLKC